MGPLSPPDDYLFALGAELLERLHRLGMTGGEGILDRLATQDLAEHVGQEVRVVQRADLRRWPGRIGAAEVTAGIAGNLLPVLRDVLGVCALGDLGLIPAPLACRINVAGT